MSTDYIVINKSKYRVSRVRNIINLLDDLGINLLCNPITILRRTGREMLYILDEMGIVAFYIRKWMQEIFGLSIIFYMQMKITQSHWHEMQLLFGSWIKFVFNYPQNSKSKAKMPYTHHSFVHTSLRFNSVYPRISGQQPGITLRITTNARILRALEIHMCY